MHEWLELATVVKRLNPDSHDLMLQALRKLAEAEALLAGLELAQILESMRLAISA